jgi:hypothetical protein
MNGFSQDLRYAARQLSRRPALAGVGVITLALGIGANTAIFSVVRGVLLRPLPYESPQRLAIIRETILSGDTINASYRNFVDWRADARSFSELAALQTTTVTLAGGEGAERVLTALASRELFQVLGVSPALGRTFRVEEDRPGGPRTAVGLWDLAARVRCGHLAGWTVCAGQWRGVHGHRCDAGGLRVSHTRGRAVGAAGTDQR